MIRCNTALICLVAMTGAHAYDNCDSLRQNNRAYQECVNNSYGANPRSSEPSYLKYYRQVQPDVQEDTTQQREWARQLELQEQRRVQESRERGRQALFDRLEINANALMRGFKSDECISTADQMAQAATYAEQRAEALKISAMCHLQNHGNDTKGDAKYRQNEFAIAEAQLKAAISAVANEYGSQDHKTHDLVRSLWAVYQINRLESEARALKQRYGLWTASDEEAYARRRNGAEANKLQVAPEEQKRAAEQTTLNQSIDLSKRGADLYKTGNFAQAIPLFREALQLRQRLANSSGFDKEYLEVAYYNLGMSLTKERAFAEAEALLKQALALRENEAELKPALVLFGPRELRQANNLSALAELYTAQQKHFLAHPYLVKLVDLQEKARGPLHIETLSSHQALAENLSAQGSDKDAALQWKRTVELAAKIPQAQDRMADLRKKLLAAYQRSGAFPEEEAALEEQIDWKAPWKRLNNAATAARKAGQHETAIAQGEQALALALKNGGPGEHLVGVSQNNLAVSHRAAKQYDAAEALYKKSVETFAQVNGTDSPSLITPMQELATLYELQSRYAEAESQYRRLLPLQEKKWGPGHATVASTLERIARNAVRNGRNAEAEPLYARALAIVEKLPDGDKSITLAILGGLSNVYRNTNRDADAVRLEAQYEKLLDAL